MNPGRSELPSLRCHQDINSNSKIYYITDLVSRILHDNFEVDVMYHLGSFPNFGKNLDMRNQIHLLRDYWNKNINKPLFASWNVFILAAIGFLIYTILRKPWSNEYLNQNIDSEIFGVFLDIVVVVLVYNSINSLTDRKREQDRIKNEKRQRIERYAEEIEDYRPWPSEEATWRLRGLIKRMNIEGVTELYLWRATLKGADLIEAHLERANLSEAYLEKINLTKAHLEGANLSGAHLEGANLSKAHLEGANLSEVGLEGANLSEAHLEGADLPGAHLEGASFFCTHLEKANLLGANLQGASLFWAHLEKANLKLSKLNKANLFEAHLDGANLWAANLELYPLEFAYLSKDTTMMDGTPYDESWAEWIRQAAEDHEREEEAPTGQ
jgi:uncharacterized protein YjbI with pentapeptide repeats